MPGSRPFRTARRRTVVLQALPERCPGMDMVNDSNGKGSGLPRSSSAGKERKEVMALMAGDFGAVVKLKDTHTNNTSASVSIVLGSMNFPNRHFHGARGEPKAMRIKIGGLHSSTRRTPPSWSGRFRLLRRLSAGELHLNHRPTLKAKYGVEVEMVDPRIAYRETIKGRANEVSTSIKTD